MRRKIHRCFTKNYLRLCVKDTPAALQPRYRTLVLKGAWQPTWNIVKWGNQVLEKESDCPRSPDRWDLNCDMQLSPGPRTAPCGHTASSPRAEVLKLRIQENHPEGSWKIWILRTHPSAILIPKPWFGTQNSTFKFPRGFWRCQETLLYCFLTSKG